MRLGLEKSARNGRLLTNVLSLLIIALFLASAHRIGAQIDTDFLEYWAAGSVLLNGGSPYKSAELFALEKQVGWKEREPLMMFNPPWILAIILPFCLLPFGLSRAIWLLVCATNILWASDLIWRSNGGRASQRWVSWMAMLFFVPAFHALILGQLSPIVLGGLVGFVAAIERKRYFLAGLFGLPIASKPHLLFGFWLVVLLWSYKNKCWRLLAGTGISLLIPVVLLSFYNPRLTLDYFVLMSSGQSLEWVTATAGMLLRMPLNLGGAWLQFLPSILGISAFLLLWHFCWKSSFSWRTHLVPVLLLSAMTTFFAWPHDMTVLLPCVISALIWVTKDPARNFWIPILIFLIDALYIQVFRSTHNALFNLWVPWALAALFIIGSKLNPAEECAGVR